MTQEIKSRQYVKPPKKPKKITNEKPKKNKCEGMKDSFKGFDWFGQTVQLTYKGEDQYKTLLGAVVSFILILVLTGYGAFKAYYLFSRFNPEITKISLLRDMSLGEVIDPSSSEFDFAFGLNSELDPSIGYFTVRQLGRYETDIKDSTGKLITNKTRVDLPIEKCGDAGFVYPNTEEIRNIGILNYNCLANKTYQLQGNFYQKKFEYLEVKLWKCQNATMLAINSPVVCKDSASIDSYFDKETFNFAFINNYFDLTLFGEDMIKPFIDDSLFFELESNRIKKANFYIQSQEAELEDDLIQFGQSKVVEFHQVEKIKFYEDNYSDKDGYIAAIYMRFDNKFDTYSRKVYSILELLGDIGGLQGSLMAIGFVFVGFISTRMFYSDIMQKIYQVRKYVMEEDEVQKDTKIHPNNNGLNDDDENQPKNYSKQKFLEDSDAQKTVLDEKAISAFQQNKINSLNNTLRAYDNVKSVNNDNTQVGNLTTPKQQAIENTARKVDTQQIELSIEEEIRQREFAQKQVFKNKKKINGEDVDNLLLSFLSRMRFNYTLKLIFDYVTRCMCFRNLSRQRNKQYYKKHYLYQKGEDKMNQELDVIQLVKTLRKFKLVAQAMLSQNNRMLLRFQRQNLLETASESSDSDDNNLDTMSLMESQNPLIRLVIFGKLKKMMGDFKGKKLKYMERNLMRGVFQRKLKDFQDELNDKAENQTLFDRLKGQMFEGDNHVEKLLDKDTMKRPDDPFNQDSKNSSSSEEQDHRQNHSQKHKQFKSINSSSLKNSYVTKSNEEDLDYSVQQLINEELQTQKSRAQNKMQLKQ
eukprot:403348330